MTDALGTQPEDGSHRNIGQIIARNTMFGVGAQLALRVASFIFTILVVRTLGDEKFGQYSIVLAWAGLFSVIGDLGINQYLAREIASKKSASDELFWDTVVLRLILAIVATLITVSGAILLTDYTSDIILGIALFTSTYFFMAVLAPVQSILTGNERVDIISTMSVLSQIIFMILAGVFLFAGLNFVWLVIANAAGMPIIGFLQWRVIRRNHLGPPRFHINTSLWGSVLKAGLPFAAVQLSLSFAYQVDTIFLSRYVTDEVVGWYSAAYRLTLTFLTLSRSFNDAVLPTLAREHTSNPKTVQQWYHISVRFILLIALPVAVGGSILSSGIIYIFGEEFLPSALAFSILIWDIPFVTFHAFCGRIATSVRRESAAAKIYVSVGILNVVLNAILIPPIGIAGACFATVITDFFGAALFYQLLRHEFGPGLELRRLLWIGAAATAMGVLVFSLRDLNIFVVVALGGICYVALVWLFPILKSDERRQIRSIPGYLMDRLKPNAIRG